MKKILFLLALSSSLVQAQNQKLGIVVDYETKKPIEFVDVFNNYDNTVTNEDGKYFFLSQNDSISFYKVGYQTKQTTFQQLGDTVYLNAKPYELAEVVLTNEDSLLDQAMKSITANYPQESYKEKFFIRSLLKYNGEISRIQDIQGKIKRRRLLNPEGFDSKKSDYVFEVQNMRKIGLTEVTENETDLYFKFRSLRDILKESISVSITPENYEIEEKYFDNHQKVRLDFTYNGEDEKVDTKGFYILNVKDNAILQFYLKAEPDLEFTEKKNIRYRVTTFEKNIIFNKDSASDTYVLKNAKITSIVEVKDQADTFQTFFESEDILKSYAHFSSMDIKKNVNENKDIFKLDFRYNKDFWNAQNQLLLTDEMLDFIEKVGNLNEEFEVKSNLN